MAHIRKTYILPRATVARMLNKAGARRVSEDAIDAFSEIIEEIATDISQKANQIAKHSGRKTIQGKDIKLAAK